jgi:hypothetical protein
MEAFWIATGGYWLQSFIRSVLGITTTSGCGKSIFDDTVDHNQRWNLKEWGANL